MRANEKQRKMIEKLEKAMIEKIQFTNTLHTTIQELMAQNLTITRRATSTINCNLIEIAELHNVIADLHHDLARLFDYIRRFFPVQIAPTPT
jgi:hypothetical protein